MPLSNNKWSLLKVGTFLNENLVLNLKKKINFLRIQCSTQIVIFEKTTPSCNPLLFCEKFKKRLNQYNVATLIVFYL